MLTTIDGFDDTGRPHVRSGHDSSPRINKALLVRCTPLQVDSGQINANPSERSCSAVEELLRADPLAAEDQVVLDFALLSLYYDLLRFPPLYRAESK